MSRAVIPPSTTTKKAATTTHAAAPIHPTPKTPAPAGSIREVKPSSDQIRVRAYQIYAERTARGDRGDAAADWLRAERELSQKIV